ncbi:MAG: LicD family protein [Lachnospiraceae bacterium]|nr:LicD family protein [Lachnospiraceae bacterium]
MENAEKTPVMLTIVDTDVIRLDQEFLDRYHGCPFIIGIDIFCLDSVPESKADEELWVNLFRAASNLYVHWDLFGGDARWQEEKWIQLRQLESLMGFPFDKGDSVKSQLLFLSDKISAMYWDVKCKEVTMLPELCEGGYYHIPKPCFDKVRELPFEDRVIPVLEDYDRICRLTYGDNYMTPVKGYAHADGIKKQIEMLRGYFIGQGKALPECFTMTFE